MTRATAAREAIAEAWLTWLEQHDVSVPELVHEAIETAATRWLDRHHDEITAAIAQACALREGAGP